MYWGFKQEQNLNRIALVLFAVVGILGLWVLRQWW